MTLVETGLQLWVPRVYISRWFEVLELWLPLVEVVRENDVQIFHKTDVHQSS